MKVGRKQVKRVSPQRERDLLTAKKIINRAKLDAHRKRSRV